MTAAIDNKAQHIDLPLGRVLITCGVDQLIKSGRLDPDFVCHLIARHSVGDWGDLCEEDREMNREALDPECPERVMSSYEVESINDSIWIITEWDRSATTVLLPEEY